MGLIATFDIGTTALKGVLMSEEGNMIAEKSVSLETIFQGDHKEQQPLDWYTEFCKISSYLLEGGSRNRIIGIALSGQMQDLIPVSGNKLPSDHAILYSDGRAEQQADRIAGLLGYDTIEAVTGNHFDGSMPFAKLLWLKENKPEVFDATEKILISAKDYVVLRMTDRFTTDVTSASTAGLMDIKEKQWKQDWMAAVGLDPALLPTICYAHDCVGYVTEKAAAECGFSVGTPVFAGTGDAGATTLASGIASDGDFNINLGTSGWIACVSKSPLQKQGVFNLAAMQQDTYINVVPFLNAGNVHKWISGILAPDGDRAKGYAYIDQLLEKSAAGSNGVLFLPYLAGERFPVMDAAARGGYVGITPETSRHDLARSVLEGVAFSIRQGLEAIGRTPARISVIGGGAKVKVWCEILADVLGKSICVYDSSEYLPAAAISAAAMIGTGRLLDYAAYINELLASSGSVCFEPNEKNTTLYREVYQTYLRMYPALKAIR